MSGSVLSLVHMTLPVAVISPNLSPFRSLISKPPVSTLNFIVTWLLLTNSCSSESAVFNTDISPSALTCKFTSPTPFTTSTARCTSSIMDISPLALIAIFLFSGISPILCAKSFACFVTTSSAPASDASWIDLKPFCSNAAFVAISFDDAPNFCISAV